MADIADICYHKFRNLIEQRGLFDNITQFLIMFSGGKDCSMMLDLFIRYLEETENRPPYSVFCAPFPKHMYFSTGEIPNDNYHQIMDYWRKRGILIEAAIPPYDDFEDNDKDGCRICKRSRKAVIDQYVNTYPGCTGIMTGFTLYDALSYLNMIFLNCNFDLSRLTEMDEPLRSTTTKMLHKMSLREHLPNDKYMLRPLLPFTEKEVLEYLNRTGIPYLTTPCKIINCKFKRLYSSALDIHESSAASYKGIERMLSKQGIELNSNALSFEDVQNDNYFIDC